MAVNGIELAIGQEWKTRGKDVVSIVGYSDHRNGNWEVLAPDSGGRKYRVYSDGRYYHEHEHEDDYDLVELIHHEPSLAGDDHEALTFHPTGTSTTDPDGWIVNNGSRPAFAGRIEVEFASGLRSDRSSAHGWIWNSPASFGDGYSIARWRPARSVSIACAPAPGQQPGHTINPKDAIGSTKLPLQLWPSEATAMGCLGMLEGALKYGRNNFIAADGVIASIYIEAAKRHLDAWFAGEELTHDTKIPHLANALATIAIIIKARAHGKLIDDRDFDAGGQNYRELVAGLTPFVAQLKEQFKDKSPKHFTIKDVK